jgi:hypothetical protein
VTHASRTRGATGAVPSPTESSALDALASVLAFVVPLWVTVARVSVFPEWRDDVAVVQSLGFVPLGGEGAPSALLAELLAVLPVGGRVLRAGLVGALGAGIAGSCLYALARRVLARSANTPRLAPFLALAAALTATLSPTWQYEGTSAGGATLAAGLGFAALLLAAAPGEELRAALGIGTLLGTLVSESRTTAAVVAAALSVGILLRRGRTASGVPDPRSGSIPGRALAVGAVAAVLFAGFFALPVLLRRFSGHGWVGVGIDLSMTPGGLESLRGSRSGPLALWSSELGPLALGLGLGGLAWGLGRARLRPFVAPWVALLVADAFLPLRAATATAADPLAPLTLLAIGGLSVAAALAVQTAALGLYGARVPLAGPAAVLLVVFQFTLVFAAAEASSETLSRARSEGADVWTDEALGELPGNALVLVRAPALAFRIWAARVARGERPDLVVVPLGLVGSGSVASDLVREEPALAAVVRDVAMSGRTSEYALAALADVRPLYVELDPGWDKRLLDHLRPTPLWLGFEAHTLGRSDRATALADESGRRAFRRVLGAARDVPGGDPATLSVLGERAREQAVVLAALGDADGVRRVLADLGRLEPGSSAFAEKLSHGLEGPKPFDPRALLE